MPIATVPNITPSLKVDCRYYGNLSLTSVAKADTYAGLVHPSLQTAFDSLAAYNRWVNERVLPIAFEWIAEHHDEIYTDSLYPHRDDVGAVIDAAFELVKMHPAYRESLETRASVEAALLKGEKQIGQCNPVWNEIDQEVREAIERIFLEHQEPQAEIPTPPTESLVSMA